ncbi:hypothetical protein PPYR_02562 [Photinus pyralis]|uniref:MRG-binding protein n=1 Tax=Photinus pyralis TaxID=7054 RepID=A0A1Y1MNJ1_PHOPY|nr:MRG/MORF4L-binding protein [Photinus pyralis]KAB0805592.1 hypothetical protein PPYR_02562 [Photinus pyralis]
MEEFDWNVQNECSLLESMIGHKPTGVNKFFQMLAIFDKFQEKVDKEIMGKVIWSHLETMYNLEALDESDIVPFPNSNIDFELPDCDFATLIEMKVEETKNVQKGCEPSKNVKDFKRDDRTPTGSVKEVHQRRDSKDSRSSSSSRKESKSDKPQKSNKGRSTSMSKDETSKSGKLKGEERGRSAKRSTRGSLKPDDGNNSGKSSPISVGNSGIKRRRI